MSESTKCYSILNATINFTAKGEPSRNRVPQGALERLERHAGKLARAVLRGLEGGNALRLLGGQSETGSNGPRWLSTSPTRLRRSLRLLNVWCEIERT